jgi:hypothetical protein
MTRTDADNDLGGSLPPPPPRLRVVHPSNQPDGQHSDSPLLDKISAVEKNARRLADSVAQLQRELGLIRADTVEADIVRIPVPGAAFVRYSVISLLIGVFGLAVWARGTDYALRVTSDTPTFLALIRDMAKHPFAAQSPFLNGAIATQHATPYMQGLAFLWATIGHSYTPTAVAGYLAVVGMFVFAFTLWCVFLYVRRYAGSTAAWISIPVLLGLFGPVHVIWASDLSIHAALYAGFFPQNVAMGTALLTLLALERRTNASLAGACALTSLTMLVHPFTGVLLCVLATVESCRLAARADRAWRRAPFALGAGFALGLLWPAYSLDLAFAETGMRGVVFVSLCVAAPVLTLAIGKRAAWAGIGRLVRSTVRRLASAEAARRLAIIGAFGMAAVAAWELALVKAPPHASARLAIYWVDDRWRWPLLFVAGSVGISGLARLARRGHIVPAVWFAGCLGVGVLGSLGLPIPVWYRFLLLCQVPLAVGVATVVAESGRGRTTAVVATTFALALVVKVGMIAGAPANVSYLGDGLQPVWGLGAHIPPGPGLVATDPSTAYFIPATTGHKVLTVDKGHVGSAAELDASRDGYQLLRRFYSGGPDWWQAAQEMWWRGVRYVVVAKQTTLQPQTLDDFIWQNALLQTVAQRKALGMYFYENNRIGTRLYDSPDYVVYRLDPAKLFPGRHVQA